MTAPLPTLAAASLSTPSDHALHAPLPDHLPVQTPAELLDGKYDIPRTVAHLQRVQPPARAVSLQFPDELLGDSVEVFRRIQAGLDAVGYGGRAFVLADTTYGSCCVDSLSALHIDSDFLVHYGHACLTRSSDPSLRLRYVFPKLALDIAACARAALDLDLEDDKGVLVMYDVGFHWALHELREAIAKEQRRRAKGKDREIIIAEIELDEQDELGGDESLVLASSSSPEAPLPASQGLFSSSSRSCCSNNGTAPADPASSTSSSGCCRPSSSPSDPVASSSSCCQGTSSSSTRPPLDNTSTPAKSASLRFYTLPPGRYVEDYAIFYVGAGESRQMSNLLTTHSRTPVYSYTPNDDLEGTTPASGPVLQSVRTNRLLMRRYAIMQKARDADVFGLLVGNVNLAGSLPLLKKLRGLLSGAHKKTYTLSVGKLNPAKLANFSEVECFVLVACGENSLVDSKDFLRPIITPFELELALQDMPDWTGDYVLDFTRLLDVKEPAEDSASNDKDAGAPAAEDEEETDAAAHDSNDEEFDRSTPLDQPVFSTITGTYRTPRRFGPSSSTLTSSSGAMQRLDSDPLSKQLAHTHLTNPNELFKNRSWVGLDPRIGMDKVAVLEEGRGGRAWGYEGEGERREKGEDVEGEQ